MNFHMSESEENDINYETMCKRKRDTCNEVEEPPEDDTIEPINETELNPMRDPFASRSEELKQKLSRNTKRTQRYRSTAQSRLGNMTVGDIRYCFQQLRNAGDDLSPEMILYNGKCAGEFALQYLQETSSATKKRRKTGNDKERVSHNNDVVFPTMEFPSSQLTARDTLSDEEHGNILDF